MRRVTNTLTEQELEIMKVVWRLGTPTVREVYEDMRTSRRIANTTVMTMMNILGQKGYLTKTSGDRAFIYTPAQPERQVICGMVRDFVDRVFNGAAEPLLLHLVEDEKLTAKEIEDIRRSAKRSKR